MGVSELRALYDGRRYDEGWSLYQATPADQWGPDGHYYGARCARYLHDYTNARLALERALKRKPIGSLLGQILFTQCSVLREIGEYRTAEEQLTQFVQGFERYPETEVLLGGPGWYNLALTLRVLRRYHEALDAYGEAIRRFRAESMSDYERQAWQNVAWVRCLLGDATGAWEALKAAVPLCSSDGARWQQRLGEAFTLSLGEHEDRIEALRLCQDICCSETAVPADAVSHAYWVAGRITLAIGQFAEAEGLARQALDWAVRYTGEKRCLHDASALLKAIQEARTSARPR